MVLLNFFPLLDFYDKSKLPTFLAFFFRRHHANLTKGLILLPEDRPPPYIPLVSRAPPPLTPNFDFRGDTLIGCFSFHSSLRPRHRSIWISRNKPPRLSAFSSSFYHSSRGARPPSPPGILLHWLPDTPPCTASFSSPHCGFDPMIDPDPCSAADVPQPPLLPIPCLSLSPSSFFSEVQTSQDMKRGFGRDLPPLPSPLPYDPPDIAP